MKLPAILLLCGIALLFNACERQSVSVLASIDAEGHGHEAVAESKSGEAAEPAHKAEAAPAPKFFPGAK